MTSLLRLLREWWDGIREQIALIAFTKAVLTLSKLAKPRVAEWATEVNKRMDAKFGPGANVVQDAVAEILIVLAEKLKRKDL